MLRDNEVIEILNKNQENKFYIIDCQDFIYFVKSVHVIGLGSRAFSSSLDFILDCENPITRDYEKVSARQLYKNKDEAQKQVDMLNNDERNKERARKWNKNKKRILKMYFWKEWVKYENNWHIKSKS